MVQEYAVCGDLFEDLKKGGGQIKEKQAVRDVVTPFLSALIYLHAQVCGWQSCCGFFADQGKCASGGGSVQCIRMY